MHRSSGKRCVKCSDVPLKQRLGRIQPWPSMDELSSLWEVFSVNGLINSLQFGQMEFGNGLLDFPRFCACCSPRRMPVIASVASAALAVMGVLAVWRPETVPGRS